MSVLHITVVICEVILDWMFNNFPLSDSAMLVFSSMTRLPRFRMRLLAATVSYYFETACCALAAFLECINLVSPIIRFDDLKSHLGVERTVSLVRDHYYFSPIKVCMKRHGHACLHCIPGKMNPGRQVGVLHPISPGHRPFATIHLDHLRLFITSAHESKFVLALDNNLTKFIIIRAINNTKMSHVIRVLKECVPQYSARLRIISNRHTCLTLKTFEQLCGTHGTRHIVYSSCHP